MGQAPCLPTSTAPSLTTTMTVFRAWSTPKFTAIDSDIRNVTDYMIFKAQGITGLPQDLNWVYGYIDPHALRTLKPNQFVILARGGALGLGVFSDLSWHKREKEHILDQLGISCEYGEEIQYGENRGTFKTLGDGEHAQMIRDYIENTIAAWLRSRMPTS